MSATVRRLLLAAMLVTTGAAAQGTPDRVFAGPARYCGRSFAIDLAAGDRVEVQQGPDFTLEALISPRGGFGLYEGFAPQDGTGDRQVDAGLGLPTYRLTKRHGEIGYVIWTGSKAAPFFVHLWGLAFKGTDRDFPLLRRLQFGADAKRGCAKPSLAP